MLAAMLSIAGSAGRAQPLPPAVRIARATIAPAARPSLRPVQFGMPMMPGMPGMMAPAQSAMPGGMGGMTMMMTGDTLMDMMAGACTAGLFIGGIATALAAGPVPASAVLTSAGVGCGFGIAATAAGVAGMVGWRELMNSLR